MKIAVIGSGPAAAGVCLGLTADGRDHDITVYDIGRTMGAGRLTEDAFRQQPKWERRVYREVHREILREGRGWVPEKSFRGDFPGKYPGFPLYRSDMFGGLSKLWGASFLPFTADDMHDWPLSESDITGAYREVMRHLQVTGAPDALDSYFPPGFYNEAPVRVPQVFHKLGAAIQNRSSGRDFDFIAGSPRLALKNSGADGCTYCGHCFYGCYNDSIYSADQTIQALARSGKIRYVPGKKCIQYTRKSDAIQIDMIDMRTKLLEPQSCDMLYIAAGCIESSRIVYHSLGVSRFPIRENPMFMVPLVYTGRVGYADYREHLALNNLLIGRLPGHGIERYVHMQIYPLNVYLWNHAMVKLMGRMGLGLSELAQQTAGKHVYMMLFYLHGSYTAGSSLEFESNGDRLRFEYRPEANRQAKLVLEQLSRVLKGSGFHLLRRLMSPLPAGGSYHFAGTLPMGGDLVADASCAIEKGVYLADSAVFPSIPAQNHSFTIMANAYRVARLPFI